MKFGICQPVYRLAVVVVCVDGGVTTSHLAAPHSQHFVIAPAPPSIATSAHLSPVLSASQRDPEIFTPPVGELHRTIRASHLQIFLPIDHLGAPVGLYAPVYREPTVKFTKKLKLALTPYRLFMALYSPHSSNL